MITLYFSLCDTTRWMWTFLSELKTGKTKKCACTRIIRDPKMVLTTTSSTSQPEAPHSSVKNSPNICRDDGMYTVSSDHLIPLGKYSYPLQFSF